MFLGCDEGRRSAWLESRGTAREFAQRAQGNYLNERRIASAALLRDLRDRTGRLREGRREILNAVIEFGYAGQPIELRRELAAIERVLGRPAAHERNVSRPIDLDLLYFGDVIIETAELRLPHPRIVDREFVLRPLADIRPDLVLPGQTEAVDVLLLRLPMTGVVRLDLEW